MLKKLGLFEDMFPLFCLQLCVVYLAQRVWLPTSHLWVETIVYILPLLYQAPFACYPKCAARGGLGTTLTSEVFGFRFLKNSWKHICSTKAPSSVN